MPNSSRGTAPDLKLAMVSRLNSDTLGPSQTSSMNLSCHQPLKESKILDSDENPEEERLF